MSGLRVSAADGGTVIARIWRGTTSKEQAEEYLHLMRTIALPDYRSIPRNRGAFALYRVDGETAYFVMITHWDSLEAVREFAGEDIEAAKYYDFDVNYLIDRGPVVEHYELFTD